MLIKLIFKENHKYISNKQKKKNETKILFKNVATKKFEIFFFFNLRGKFNLKKREKR